MNRPLEPGLPRRLRTVAAGQATTCLIVPGLGGSGPGHWQTLWEAGRDDCVRIEMDDWDEPVRTRWIAAIDAAVAADDRRKILVGHSLGCLAIAWWASGAGSGRLTQVAGALLVAPPDVHQQGADYRLRRFAPPPPGPLPVPTILIASRDDRYASIDRSRALANLWRATFVDAGARGHLNADSGLGPWPEGQAALARLAGGR